VQFPSSSSLSSGVDGDGADTGRLLDKSEDARTRSVTAAAAAAVAMEDWSVSPEGAGSCNKSCNRDRTVGEKLIFFLMHRP